MTAFQRAHGADEFVSELLCPPCSELAFQLADQFRALGAGMSLKDCVVVGGLDMQQQVGGLAAGGRQSANWTRLISSFGAGLCRELESST